MLSERSKVGQCIWYIIVYLKMNVIQVCVHIHVYKVYFLKIFLFIALAGVGQWIERTIHCKPKGHWFDSQSGHMPGLQARSPAGGI